MDAALAKLFEIPSKFLNPTLRAWNVFKTRLITGLLGGGILPALNFRGSENAFCYPGITGSDFRFSKGELEARPR
jgi:hypothetical protein